MAYWFERMMEHTGASNEEAPPTNMNRKDLTKSQHLEVISILRVKFIGGHFERGALSTSPKCSTWHAPQFGDYGNEQHARMW